MMPAAPLVGAVTIRPPEAFSSFTAKAYRLTQSMARDGIRLVRVALKVDQQLRGTSRHLQIIFDTEVVRTWERRSLALDTVGDGLFLIFAQDYAPLAERLDSIAGRLEAVPAYLEESPDAGRRCPRSGSGSSSRSSPPADLPSFFDEIVAAGARPRRRRTAPPRRRRRTAADGRDRRLRDWLKDHSPAARTTGRSVASGTTSWSASGVRRARRRRDPGDRRGAACLEPRRRVAAAREIDPTADEATVVDRIKSDHPATFEEALDAYRDVMVRAARHLIEKNIVTVPDDERIDVIPTPDYLRNVIPFAAYFSPPKFDPRPKGIYIVTPSVGNDPNAMREHNYSSISNTSIHEAYPGHHLQLAVANRHPS